MLVHSVGVLGLSNEAYISGLCDGMLLVHVVHGECKLRLGMEHGTKAWMVVDQMR